MSLAIFDLDNTLLAGDSDYLWGRFLIDHQLVDSEFFEQENLRFLQEYEAGSLDIFEFLEFTLRPLTEMAPEQLTELHQQFMAEKIQPIILPKALALIDKHRRAGDTLMIVTATNSFITGPIADALGIEHLIATEPEKIDGRYTGRVAGTPSFRHGKVTRLEEWLQHHDENLDGSWFYSDSHNDLPLLEMVENPVAVDADTTLTGQARVRGWPIISLRDVTH